jgi:hypothetical protein
MNSFGYYHEVLTQSIEINEDSLNSTELVDLIFKLQDGTWTQRGTCLARFNVLLLITYSWNVLFSSRICVVTLDSNAAFTSTRKFNRL